MFVNADIVLPMGSKDKCGEADSCGALLYKAAPFYNAEFLFLVSLVTYTKLLLSE